MAAQPLHTNTKSVHGKHISTLDKCWHKLVCAGRELHGETSFNTTRVMTQNSCAMQVHESSALDDNYLAHQFLDGISRTSRSVPLSTN